MLNKAAKPAKIKALPPNLWVLSQTKSFARLQGVLIPTKKFLLKEGIRIPIEMKSIPIGSPITCDMLNA